MVHDDGGDDVHEEAWRSQSVLPGIQRPAYRSLAGILIAGKDSTPAESSFPFFCSFFFFDSIVYSCEQVQLADLLQQQL